MNKALTIGIALVILTAGLAHARMDDAGYSISLTGIETNSQNAVIRGSLEAIHVEVLSGAANHSSRTNVFTVTSLDENRTVWQGDVRGAANTHIFRPIRYVTVYDANDAVLPYTVSGAVTNQMLHRVPLAGPVRVQGVSLDASNTNTYRIRLIYER